MSNEPLVIQGLVQRGVPLHIAQGIAANMIAESRLDPGINEIAPLVPGSRGGFGLNQWTGPRRRALEAAADQRGVPVNDLDFQLDYTMEELQGTENRAWQALQGASNAEEAARLYSERFLRPGIPHLDARLAHARRIAGGGDPYQSSGGTTAQASRTAPAGGGGRNALAGDPLMMEGGTVRGDNALAVALQRQEADQMNALAMAQPQGSASIPMMDTRPAPFQPIEYRQTQNIPVEFRPRSVRRQA